MLTRLVEIRKAGKIPVYQSATFFQLASGLYECAQVDGLLTRAEAQAWIDSHVPIDGSPHLIWAEKRIYEPDQETLAVVNED